jgi:uncharacterized protein (TIGR02246 family)
MSDDPPSLGQDDRRADEDAIREVLGRQIAGWDAGDPAYYASVFTPDADYVTFLGSHYKGRDAIASSYAPLFKKLLKGTHLETEITELRFLTPDIALIQANAVVRKGTQRWSRRAIRVNTSIAVRTDGGWLLAASQNTTHRRCAEKLMSILVSRQGTRR